MPIYMMDCFYRDAEGRLDSVGRERKRIVAHDDRRAITAAESMAILVKPAFFELHTTSPKNRIIYMSPVQARGLKRLTAAALLPRADRGKLQAADRRRLRNVEGRRRRVPPPLSVEQGGIACRRGDRRAGADPSGSGQQPFRCQRGHKIATAEVINA